MANADLNVRVKVDPKDPFKNALDGLNNFNNGIGSVTSKILGIGAALAGIGASSAAFNFILDATKDMEDLTNQFKRFTSSTAEAEQQLIALSNIPGPSLKELTEANTTLLSFGVGLQESVKLLSQFNDVSAATGASIGKLADIIGKIEDEGNLTGETFKKLSREIPGFGNELAKSIGVSRSALQGLVKDGKITSDQITKAFGDMTKEGGVFFEQGINKSMTLTGSISGLMDSVTALAAEFGKVLTPSIAQSNISVSGFINRVTDAIRVQRQFWNDDALGRIRQIDGDIKALNNTLTYFQNIANTKNEFFKSIKALPQGGIDGVEHDIRGLTQRINELKKARDELVEAKGTENFQKTMEKLAGQRQAQADKEADRELAAREAHDKELLDQSFKAAEERGKAIQQSEQNITKLIAQENEARAAIQATQNEKAANDLANQMADQEEISRIALQKGIEESQVVRDNAALVKIEQERVAQEALTMAILESESARAEQLLSARVEEQAKLLELNNQNDEAEKLRMAARNKAILDIQKKGQADALKTTQQARDNEFNFQKIMADAQIKFDQQTWQQRAETLQVGLQAIAGLMSSGNRDLFNAGKAAALASAAISIPSIAIKTFDSIVAFGGPVIAGIGAALAVAAQLVQLDKIRSAQPPKFAEGGLIPGIGSGDTVPILTTPGEVVVPSQNFEELKQSFIAGATASDQINLIRQSNDLLSRILDTLTVGTINEKLTTIISSLGVLNVSVSRIDSGGGRGRNTESDVEEIAKNQPQTSSTAGSSKVGTRTRQR